MSEEVKAAVVPTKHDAGWTKYVLGLLTEDEVYDEKYPTANGLRRVVGSLLGKIVRFDSDELQCPNEVNNYTAVVQTVLVVKEGDGTELQFKCVADAGPNNTVAPFNKFPSAMAETRSEGRVLRRALMLNVVTAEEMPDFNGQKKSSGEDIPFSDDSPTTKVDTEVSPAQIKAIDVIAGRFDIDVLKVLEKKEYSLAKLTSDEAKDVLKELQSLQKEVPEDVKGYNKQWSEKQGDK